MAVPRSRVFNARFTDGETELKKVRTHEAHSDRVGVHTEVP